MVRVNLVLMNELKKRKTTFNIAMSIRIWIECHQNQSGGAPSDYFHCFGLVHVTVSEVRDGTKQGKNYNKFNRAF